MEEFERAKDKIMMGAERRSMVMTEEEKRNTAYHESGHAIVGLSVPEHDPVYKVTIIPRGRALGVTMFLPEADRYSTSKRQLESRIATLFGGRIAEELVFGADAVTTGASNDIERATELARNMVTRWGLSDRLGPQTYSEESGEVFLGRSVTQHKQVSDVTAHVIDEEVRRVIDSNYQRAYKILQTNMDKLQTMSEALIKYETIDEEMIKDIMEGRAPRPPRDWDDTPTPTPRPAARRSRRRRSLIPPANTKIAAVRSASRRGLEQNAAGNAPSAQMSNAVALSTSHHRSDAARRHGHSQRHPGFVFRRRALCGVDAALGRAAHNGGGGGGHHRRGRRVDAARRLYRRCGGGDRACGAGHRGHCGCSMSAISIDTSKPEVMAAAVAAGACIINDVYALREPGARAVAAKPEVGVCLMHMQGEPRTMQDRPHYHDVVAEVMAFLVHERRACIAAGVASDAIALDPGFGFGKRWSTT